MSIHKEGYPTLILTILFIGLVNYLVYQFSAYEWINYFFVVLSIGFFLLILQFFRNPTRNIPKHDNNIVYAPADGKVVVIEEIQPDEYFEDRRIQLSIFMSPTNVHINRVSFDGKVTYSKYHEGKYMVAWHPKTSTENERNSVVINNGKHEVLFKQIAGAVARRVVNYLKEGQEVKQGQEMGFIKFGSRMDIILPLDAEILVNLEDNVKSNLVPIARLSH